MQQRLLMILIAAAVGVLFAAGLFFHGAKGAGLLLITDAILIAITVSVWGDSRPQGRPVRIAVITIIAAIAVAKLVK
jgi:hypothetical protein